MTPPHRKLHVSKPFFTKTPGGAYLPGLQITVNFAGSWCSRGGFLLDSQYKAIYSFCSIHPRYQRYAIPTKAGSEIGALTER